MRIASLSPYYFNDCEAGLIYLTSAYLKHLGIEVAQVLCDGICGACARDEVSGWQRTLSSCLSCVKEQKIASNWGEFDVHNLSQYLEMDSVMQLERLILSEPNIDFHSVEYGDMLLIELVQDNFYSRFKREQPDVKNKDQIEFLQKLLISAARLTSAAKQFLQIWRPDFLFMADSGDMFVRVFGKIAKEQGLNVSLISCDREKRTSAITHPSKEMVLTCDMLFSDITSMRRDCSTWPREMLDLLQEILNFLGFFDKDVPGIRRVG